MDRRFNYSGITGTATGDVGVVGAAAVFVMIMMLYNRCDFMIIYPYKFLN